MRNVFFMGREMKFWTDSGITLYGHNQNWYPSINLCNALIVKSMRATLIPELGNTGIPISCFDQGVLTILMCAGGKKVYFYFK